MATSVMFSTFYNSSLQLDLSMHAEHDAHYIIDGRSCERHVLMLRLRYYGYAALAHKIQTRGKDHQREMDTLGELELK